MAHRTNDRYPTMGRRRLPRSVYLRRRAAVLAGMVVVCLGIGVGVRALFGADPRAALTDSASAGAEDTAATVPSASGASTSDPTTAPGAPVAAGSSSLPVTDGGRPDGWVPTVDDPARLYIVGDSDAGTFGPYLQTLMAQTAVVTTTLDYKVSSGLSRPDFYDWPARLAEQLPIVRPDIIVVTFGGNDAQGINTVDGQNLHGVPNGDGDVEWRAEYQRRVLEVVDLLADYADTVIWVGIPNHANPEDSVRFRVQNETVMAVLAERPDVVFIDTWKRFAGRDGDSYAEFVVDPRDQQGKDVRADDGFHLNENGAEILALDIAEAIRTVLREQGAID
jgi:uncharacterized protein